MKSHARPLDPALLAATSLTALFTSPAPAGTLHRNTDRTTAKGPRDDAGFNWTTTSAGTGTPSAYTTGSDAVFSAGFSFSEPTGILS